MRFLHEIHSEQQFSGIKLSLGLVEASETSSELCWFLSGIRVAVFACASCSTVYPTGAVFNTSCKQRMLQLFSRRVD